MTGANTKSTADVVTNEYHIILGIYPASVVQAHFSVFNLCVLLLEVLGLDLDIF